MILGTGKNDFSIVCIAQSMVSWILLLYSVYRRKLHHWKVEGITCRSPTGDPPVPAEFVKDFDEAEFRRPFGKETGATCAFQPMIVLFREVTSVLEGMGTVWKFGLRSSSWFKRPLEW